MNFGHKITIAIILFVLFMGTLVTISFRQKNIFLVKEDYYSDEIVYQNEINRQSNLKNLSAPVEIQLKDNIVAIQLPTEMAGAYGEIHFYRPSDANLDFKMALDLDENQSQKIEVGDKARGKWTVKLKWTKSGQEYSTEKILVL